MANLSSYRNTPKMGERTIVDVLSIPIADNVKIFVGSMVGLNAAGYAVPAQTVPNGQILLGVAQVPYQPQAGLVGSPSTVYDNTITGHALGALQVTVRAGVYKFDNSGTDAVDQTCVGKEVYASDDHTVAKTSNVNTLPTAGRCVQVDSDGVWVQFSIFG